MCEQGCRGGHHCSQVAGSEVNKLNVQRPAAAIKAGSIFSRVAPAGVGCVEMAQQVVAVADEARQQWLTFSLPGRCG